MHDLSGQYSSSEVWSIVLIGLMGIFSTIFYMYISRAESGKRVGAYAEVHPEAVSMGSWSKSGRVSKGNQSDLVGASAMRKP